MQCVCVYMYFSFFQVHMYMYVSMSVYACIGVLVLCEIMYMQYGHAK